MSIKNIRIEVLGNLLEDNGIILSSEILSQISEDFSYHLEMEREMEHYAHIPSKISKCEKCENKDFEIKRLSEEVKIYNNSVKRRRNASHVWIEGNDVRYE